MTFPEPTTPRLRLRRLVRTDGDLLYRFNGDVEALRWIARDPYTDPAQGEAKAASFAEANETGAALWWVFERRDDGAPIGYGGLFGLDADALSAEVGYGLLPGHWGRGYAGEAVRALVDAGFDELALHRIHARVAPGNTASARLLATLGFVREGTLRECEHARGKWFDMDLFALLEDERPGSPT